MKKPLNKEKLRAFIQRRRINAAGLLVITLFSAVITVICAFKRFPRTDLLAIVTLLLVCGMTHRQAYKDIGVVTVLVPFIGLVAVMLLGMAVPGLS